jgi:hypothetical protein
VGAISLKIYYSASVNGFFHEGLQDNFPSDSVEISKDTYEELQLAATLMHRIVPNEFGYPSLESIPETDPRSWNEKIWVEQELQKVRDELEKVQDSDTNAVGSVSTWRTYRKALRAWQDNENFPNVEFRPKYKDSV